MYEFFSSQNKLIFSNNNEENLWSGWYIKQPTLPVYWYESCTVYKDEEDN